MSNSADLVAAASAIALGAFWPTLKVHFELSFTKRFVLPAFAVAVADCFVLSQSLGWWTLRAYPVLVIAGATIIGAFASGKYVKILVLMEEYGFSE